MRLASQEVIIPNKNKLTAVWRDLTEKQIKALPLTGKEAYAIGIFYYYPGVVCMRNHISPKARSGRSCMMCREEDRKKKIITNINFLANKKINSIFPTVIFGIRINTLLSKNKD